MSISLHLRFGAVLAAGLIASAAPAAAGTALVLAQAPQAQQPQQDPEQGGEDQQQFLEALRELLAPALDGVTSFAPDADNPDVVKIETSDPALPAFFANLIEEEAAYSPEQTMEQIRSGFSACRDEQAAERNTAEQVTMASFTVVCRTEEGGELQMYVITLNDSDRTQALMLGTPIQHGPALIERGRRVFQGLTGGTR